MRYYHLFRQEKTTVFSFDFRYRNDIVVTDRIFGSFGSKRESQASSQRLEYHLAGDLFVSRLATNNARNIVCAHASCRKVDFKVNSKPHDQIVALLPKSIEQFPIVAILSPTEVFSSFLVLPSESLSHGILIKFLTLCQLSIPYPPEPSFNSTESDTFGRYTAKYLQQKGNHPVFTKKRDRYIYSPVNQAQGNFRTKIQTEDKIRIDLVKNGETITFSCITRVISQEALTTEESTRGTLRYRSEKSLSSSERKMVLDHLSSRNRVEQMPWVPITVNN
jgi:hypothetical protein